MKLFIILLLCLILSCRDKQQEAIITFEVTYYDNKKDTFSKYLYSHGWPYIKLEQGCIKLQMEYVYETFLCSVKKFQTLKTEFK